MESLKLTNKIFNLLLAVTVVVMAASGTYLVSKRVAMTQRIAPDAPESKPEAKKDNKVYCEKSDADKPAGKKIKFEKSGKIIAFTRDNLTLKLVGTTTITRKAPADTSAPVQMGEPFDVVAGEEYTISTKIGSGDGGEWISGEDGLCGPKKKPCTYVNKVCKGCGPQGSIEDLLDFAKAKVVLSGIMAGETNATAQCWGDPVGGDWTSDYDFNDATLVMGYQIGSALPTASPTVTVVPTATVAPTVTVVPTSAICIDSSWSPDPNTICSGGTLSQTSNCGTARTVAGTKYCCTDSSWSPNPSLTCSQTKLYQTSNCGNGREVDGTKTCYPSFELTKKVFKDAPKNSSGDFVFESPIYKAERGQSILYAIEVTNTGEGEAKDLVISDTLTGQNQDLVEFVEADKRCTYDHSAKKISCKIPKLASQASERYGVKVKVKETAINGKVIRNTGKLSYGSRTKEASVTILTSSIVNCNEYCESDSQCSKGLTCDVFSNTCRKPACTKEAGCVCQVVTVTPTVTATATLTPTGMDFPEDGETTVTATLTQGVPVAEEEVVATELPRTGILDLPGAVTFGGGLIMAVLGILLAL